MPRPAPPPPPVMPPPTPYHDQRQGELDALKQRGLARMLNKHFTTVTKSLAEEKAAADAALRDLERRKANTSAVQTPSYGDLSPHDKLYLELQKKKADCKKKERETLLLYQRYVDKFGSTGAVTIPSVPFVSPDSSRQAAPTDSARRPAPSKDLVPQLATSIDKTVEGLVEKGADQLPSSHTMGMDETYQKVHASLEDQDRAFARKLDNNRGVDARSTPKGSKTLARGGWQKLPGVPEPPLVTDTPVSNESGTENSDESTEKRNPLEGSNITLPTADATVDAKSEESDDSNDKSVVSGLTSVEGMSDAEVRLLEYLKSETEAIRKILEEEEVTSYSSKTSKGTSYSTEVASQTDLAAKQAEVMLDEMQKILAESQAEAHSVDAAVSESKRHEPRKLETPNPDEHWMVYWDENHKREYYHEVNSNIVQWECPVPSDRPATIHEASQYSPQTLVPMSDFTKKNKSVGRSFTPQQLTYEDVMPDVNAASLGRASSSRRLKYRQKQRRRRRRRRRIVVLATVMLICGGVYYKDQVGKAVNDTMSHVHPHLPAAMQWEEQDETFLEAIESFVCELLPEPIKCESPREIKQEADRKAREVAAKTKKQEQQEAERKAREEKARKEEEARKATEAALQALEDEHERALAVAEPKENRPFLCNIPLAYLFHPRCWRVAKTNPIFDLKELVQAMMQ